MLAGVLAKLQLVPLNNKLLDAARHIGAARTSHAGRDSSSRSAVPRPTFAHMFTYDDRLAEAAATPASQSPSPLEQVAIRR